MFQCFRRTSWTLYVRNNFTMKWRDCFCFPDIYNIFPFKLFELLFSFFQKMVSWKIKTWRYVIHSTMLPPFSSFLFAFIPSLSIPFYPIFFHSIPFIPSHFILFLSIPSLSSYSIPFHFNSLFLLSHSSGLVTLIHIFFLSIWGQVFIGCWVVGRTNQHMLCVLLRIPVAIQRNLWSYSMAKPSYVTWTTVNCSKNY